MKNLFTLVIAMFTAASFLANHSNPSNLSSKLEKEVGSEISKVTVFLSSAQIFRTGQVNVKPGKNNILIKGLSPYLDPESIRLEIDEEVTILSLNHTLNYLSDKSWSTKVDSLNHKLKGIQDSIQQFEAEIFVQEQKEKLLNKNQDMRTASSGVDLDKLSKALDLYDQIFQQIKMKKDDLTSRIEMLIEKGNWVQKELSKNQSIKSKPFSEIRIGIQSERSQQVTFEFSYLTTEAGWYPKYDVRAKDVSSPIDFQYKGLIYQRTREDWKNVKLTFSSANPKERSTAPGLRPWKLNYARLTTKTHKRNRMEAMKGEISGVVTDETGEPLIGANILIHGTSIGTVTDIDGRFNLVDLPDAQMLQISYVGYGTLMVPKDQMNIQMNEHEVLSEVVVTALGSSASSRNFNSSRAGNTKKANTTVRGNFVESQTHFSIEVEIPYTILSDGEPFSIPLENFEIKADYHYEIVPKMDTQAYLMATIRDYDLYHILDGEANLFFEKTFVGRTYLLAESFADSTVISLGRDNGIAVSRNKIKEFSKRQFLGNKKIDTRGVEVIVRNNKKESVDVRIVDQIPVSVNNQIEVIAEEISNGDFDEVSGRIEWRMTLRPRDEKKLSMQYLVKYPKGERILLE